MFASRTGIALSISCIVDCTDVTASIRREEPVSAAMVRWKRESACRCTAGPLAVATASCAASSRSTCASPSWQLAASAGAAGLHDPAEVEHVRPVRAP